MPKFKFTQQDLDRIVLEAMGQSKEKPRPNLLEMIKAKGALNRKNKA